MPMLKLSANIFYVIFSETCQPFKVLREVNLALRDFSREARKRMTMATKVSILWSMLLQSRQFALGEVNILCEFTTMHDDLRAKRSTIHHSEMPLELLKNSTEKTPPSATRTPEIQVVDIEKIQNNPRLANLNNWHPKLKADLEGPLKEAGNPTFTKIIKFCKKDAYAEVPKGSPICAPNYLFGSFFSERNAPRKISSRNIHRYNLSWR